MRKYKTFSIVSLTFLLFAFTLISAMTQTADAGAWKTAVDPWVLQTAAENGETEFLVFLTEQADLSAAESLATKLDKGTYVYQQLTATAARTQPAVTAALDNLGVQYRPYWVANMIWVRGDAAVVQSLAERDDISHIYANPTVKADLPTQEEYIEQMAAIEWNILMVNADDVWAEGYTGQGAVIGGQDTGYDWDHPALINSYRGWNGATADHNYNWHDSIHVPNGTCPADSPEPCDDVDHGTHTMGTMVGDDGGSNQTGMAPGAKWIGCRNMNAGNGTPASYSACYEWFIAPTDLNNANPNPAMAPHAINNSWSCPPSEGCTDPNVMLTIVQNLRAAGILTAHSAGNGGASGCSTVRDPATIYAESFSVGSTTNGDTVSSFSSRGPVTIDGSNRLKPDISAPGSSVRSTLPGGGYGTKTPARAGGHR
jgi:subtilisin family serine protease